MTEPKCVNKLSEQAEKLRDETASCFVGTLPAAVQSVFSDMSFFFHEQVAFQWLAECKYDDLIDYILYEYEETGGEELWGQLLLELRQNNEEDKADRLLDGLYPARSELLIETVQNLKKEPDNHFGIANVAKARGEVMKVLYEHAFLLENKPKEQQNDVLVNKVRDRIKYIMNL